MLSSSSPPSGRLEKVFQYIDLHQDEFVQTLREWVAIESDSVQPVPRLRQEVFRMMALAADKLRHLGAVVHSVDLGSQQIPDGHSLPIPPIVLAELGNDPKKPTVCFYGHLDVQPAQKDDGWLTDPYTLTEVDGKLYGRGATDNKGPVLAWINAVGSFRALEQDLPVNIKFILEGMEEAGSVALEELVKREKDHFFSSVNYIVISDNLWISQKKPALTYGTRGNCYFMVEVKCRDQDFHSGTFGGILNEPMADLVALLGSLVDASGHILIPGIYDQMAPLTEEEKEMYKNIDLNLEEYQKSSQVEKFLFDTKIPKETSRETGPLTQMHKVYCPSNHDRDLMKLADAAATRGSGLLFIDTNSVQNCTLETTGEVLVSPGVSFVTEELLMHLWRYPSLSIHGIEGAFDEPGTKTVIPGRVIGKFSIRLVPHMNLSVVEKQVRQHLEAVFDKRNSFNKMAVSMVLGLHPWSANINDTQYLAAKRAIKTVFGVDPDMIQDGSTIPIAKLFQTITQKSVMMLPLGAVDDGEHSQNEKINRWNYIQGSKLFAAFFLELSKQPL